MEENRQEHPSAIGALHKASSFFFMPVRLTGKWKTTLRKSQTWQQTRMKIEQGIFYSHVLHFLEGTEAGSDAYDFQVYNPIGNDNLHLLWCRFELTVKTDGGQRNVTLTTSDSKLFLGPKLIVCGGAETAILILPLHAANDELTVKELMKLNYDLHKKIAKRKLKVSNDKGYSDKLTIDELCARLMRDLDGCYTRLNEWRTHVLTYLHADSSADFTREDLIRIMRCETDTYQITGDDRLFTPFQNIIYGASAEGGVCCVKCPDRKYNFFEGYDTGVLFPRYMWLYIMAYMQRSALTMTEADLTLTDNAKWQSEQLKAVRSLSERIARMRVGLSFEAVSDISQHNDFLKYVEGQFALPGRWQAVEKKSDSLERWLVRRTERRAETFRTLLLFVISLLSVTSVLNGGLGFIQRFFDKETPVLTLLGWLAVVVVAVVAMTFIMRYVFLKWADRKR